MCISSVLKTYRCSDKFEFHRTETGLWLPLSRGLLIQWNLLYAINNVCWVLWFVPLFLSPECKVCFYQFSFLCEFVVLLVFMFCVFICIHVQRIVLPPRCLTKLIVTGVFWARNLCTHSHYTYIIYYFNLETSYLYMDMQNIEFGTKGQVLDTVIVLVSIHIGESPLIRLLACR